MAYFDRTENSSSAVNVRLSSDAAALEQMVVSRLGVISEPFAMCFFGFLAGIFVSWQLTLVIVLAFFFTSILVFT